MINLNKIDTERPNPASAKIDQENTAGILSIINSQDQLVALAVGKVLGDVAEAVDVITEKLSLGGRLIYLGSGTSGRLGVLDAVECPPTFGVDSSLVVGLMAGGSSAFVKAKEGAEDDRKAGEIDLKEIGFSAKDALVGLAASGRTPYVMGGMAYANSLGAPVIALTCSSKSEMAKLAQITIAPDCGPEVITGSTRMKCGTAQKMVLNMITTAVMIKLGKVYGNLMVDVKASNKKLQERAVSIVMQATGAEQAEAAEALDACSGNCKTAIVCIKCSMTCEEAVQALENENGFINRVLEKYRTEEV